MGSDHPPTRERLNLGERAERLDKLAGRTVQPHRSIKKMDGCPLCPAAEGACTVKAWQAMHDLSVPCQYL
jgi:hypothetical protein